MASRSLGNWKGDRLAALARLEQVHVKVTGGLAGRPRDVTELNHALFLRLAAEIQAFCRDLHDEAIEALCGPSQMARPVADTVRNALSRGRKLDAGNAGPGQIGNDWTYLGEQLWTDLHARYPGVRGSQDWNARLSWLNHARNGIAHNDTDKIAAAHAQHPLTLATFRVTRGRLDKFADALDRVTGAHLKSMTGVDPW